MIPLAVAVTEAVPVDAPLFAVDAERAALAPEVGAVNVKGTLARRFPLASAAVACNAAGNGVPIAVACGEPLCTETLATGFGVLVLVSFAVAWGRALHRSAKVRRVLKLHSGELTASSS